MITADEAIKELYLVAQGPYPKGPSYSCVKEFTESYPKKKTSAFIADGLPKQIGRGGGNRTHSTTVKA
jgi:hypothetical protein